MTQPERPRYTVEIDGQTYTLEGLDLDAENPRNFRLHLALVSAYQYQPSTRNSTCTP